MPIILQTSTGNRETTTHPAKDSGSTTEQPADTTTGNVTDTPPENVTNTSTETPTEGTSDNTPH
ncbi:MAG TPA: hypothetical protein VJY62_16345 [Bacteroidia bacterium]|nr:hypothetical protein [Bacteroidia bacterium]